MAPGTRETRKSVPCKFPMMKRKSNHYESRRLAAPSIELTLQDMEYWLDTYPENDTRDKRSLKYLCKLLQGDLAIIGTENKKMSKETRTLAKVANADGKVVSLMEFCKHVEKYRGFHWENGQPVIFLNTDTHLLWDAVHEWSLFRIAALQGTSNLDNGWYRHGARLMMRYQHWKLTGLQDWWLDGDAVEDAVEDAIKDAVDDAIEDAVDDAIEDADINEEEKDLDGQNSTSVARRDGNSSISVDTSDDQMSKDENSNEAPPMSNKRIAPTSWKQLDDDATLTTKKACVRSATVAHNREEVSVSAKFIEAVRCEAPVPVDIYTEGSFPDGTRFDICMEWNYNDCHYMAIVESKVKNVLHGLGQVLHYRRFLPPDVRVISIVAVEKEHDGFDERYATVRSHDVHVWWPGNSVMPILEFE
jgi:hypothetical protein